MKFLCDHTVGKLAKWLRILGVDTAYTNTVNIKELVKKSLREQRIILTRNRFIRRLKMARGTFFLLESDFVFPQLEAVIKAYKIEHPKLLSRCTYDNEILVEIDREIARERVPDYVYRTNEKFRICPQCKRLYWRGTHPDKIIEKLKEEHLWTLLF